MYDIIIIGGGAAGLSAAMFSARERLKTLVLTRGPETSALGLQASVTDMPGFEGGISGRELLARMEKQACSFGVEIKTASAMSCVLDGNEKKRVTTNEPATYETKAIILATGNMPQQDSHVYQGEKELRGKGVSHDAEADGPACSRAAAAIVGKSAATAEAILKLSHYAEKVYWIIPASKLDISDNLKDELEKIKKVEPLFSSSLKRINGDSNVSSVSVLTGGQEKTFAVKYVFLPPLQHRPVTDYLNGTNIQTGPEGVIMVGQQLETSISGVFAAGNILCSKPQMSIICAAQGAIAALGAEKYLQSL